MSASAAFPITKFRLEKVATASRASNRTAFMALLPMWVDASYARTVKSSGTRAHDPTPLCGPRHRDSVGPGRCRQVDPPLALSPALEFLLPLSELLNPDAVERLALPGDGTLVQGPLR